MKYVIISVDDRAKENSYNNKKIMSSHNIELAENIVFFNGNIENGWDVLNHKKIPLNTWNPYDGRTMPPLPGEYGIWVSTLNVLEYVVENNIESMLVIEDDVLLEQDFVENLNKCVADLPSDFDFLSLFSFEEQNELDKNTDIGSDFIHKSSNQFSAAQAILYSRSGADKIIKLLRRKGVEYTPDCFIYKQAQLGWLNGYSVIPQKMKLLKHDYQKVKSLIDPNNSRDVGLA